MPDLCIEPIDVSDATQLIAWNDVLRRGYSAGREAVWWRSAEATVAQFQVPKPGRTSVALWAIVGGTPVGAAEAHVDAGEPAEVEISVLPDRRRTGVGSALADAVRAALSGVAEVVQAETYRPEGIVFARAHGLAVGNEESRQLLELPLPRHRLAELERAAGEVEVRSWSGPCPDDLVDDQAALITQMTADVPMGELTRSDAVTDAAAVRRDEQRTSSRGDVLVQSLARLDGRSVGYTQMVVSLPDPRIVFQDDTFVARDHRGRGIARALKLANLRALSGLPAARTSRWVQTYTSLDNAPMLALNRAFGFREADTMTALEGRLG